MRFVYQAKEITPGPSANAAKLALCPEATLVFVSANVITAGLAGV